MPTCTILGAIMYKNDPEYVLESTGHPTVCWTYPGWKSLCPSYIYHTYFNPIQYIWGSLWSLKLNLSIIF